MSSHLLRSHLTVKLGQCHLGLYAPVIHYNVTHPLLDHCFWNKIFLYGNTEFLHA